MLYNTLGCFNISIIRDNTYLLRNLGFTLFSGSILRVIGSNGIGKTSLLKTMAGLSPPNSGQIVCNQTDIKLDLETYYSMTNYLGHTDAVHPELTVFENIKFWAAIYNSMETLDAAIEHMGLQDLLNIPVAKLSRGFKKRVALTTLLIVPKCFWILDEPFVNLDAFAVERLRYMITAKSSQGGIVIISSHTEQDGLSDGNIDSKCITNLFLEQFSYHRKK